MGTFTLLESNTYLLIPNLKSGIMGFTQSGDPFVGPAPGDDLKGQFISAGFSGHGMPRAFAW